MSDPIEEKKIALVRADAETKLTGDGSYSVRDLVERIRAALKASEGI